MHKFFFFYRLSRWRAVVLEGRRMAGRRQKKMRIINKRFHELVEREVPNQRYHVQFTPSLTILPSK